MFSHVVRKRKKEREERGGKRQCKQKDATDKLFEVCEAKRSDGLRFKKTTNLKTARTLRLQKTAWSTSEDEGALWDLGGNTWSWEDVSFPEEPSPAGAEQLRQVYQQLKKYLNALPDQSFPQDCNSKVKQGSEPLSVKATPPPPQRSASAGHVSLQAASAIVSWKTPDKTQGALTNSTCTIKPPPSVSPPRSSTCWSLSEATSAYEYESVIAHYEKRLEAMYARYNPDKLRDIPGILRKYSLCLDQAIRVMVQKYGPEPGRPPPPMIDYQARLECYLADTDPSKIALIPEYLKDYEGNEETAVLQLILCTGMRERLRPEEAFLMRGSAPRQQGGRDEKRLFFRKVAAYLQSSGKAIRVERDYLNTLSGIFAMDYRKCIRSLEVQALAY